MILLQIYLIGFDDYDWAVLIIAPISIYVSILQDFLTHFVECDDHLVLVPLVIHLYLLCDLSQKKMSGIIEAQK